MCLFSVAFLTALVVPLAAFAQSIKQVEVINLPAVQDVSGTVEVTNLPSSTRVHLVGLADGIAIVPMRQHQAGPQYNQLCKDTFGGDSFVCTAKDLSRVGESEIIAAGLGETQCAWLWSLPEDARGEFRGVYRGTTTGVIYTSGCNPDAELPSPPLCCAEQ